MKAIMHVLLPKGLCNYQQLVEPALISTCGAIRIQIKTETT
jgi:hypothetical protein